MTEYYRKVIRITAEDSPNIKLARAEIQAGKKPSNETLILGVKGWDQYCTERGLDWKTGEPLKDKDGNVLKDAGTWDHIMKQIGHDAQFYEGAESLMFPPDWIHAAIEQGRKNLNRYRKPVAIGVDPAEGGDRTVAAVVDELGIVLIDRLKLPYREDVGAYDTSVITGWLRDLMRKHNVPPEKVFFDAGGGGTQHANLLRSQGFKVQTVAFGQRVNNPIKRGQHTIEQRRQIAEQQYVYKDRRAQMYGLLSNRLNPGIGDPWGIPPNGEAYVEFRRQISKIPKTLDGEGRLYLIPKRPNKRKGGRWLSDYEARTEPEESLIKLIGHSPDEADAVALAVYGMDRKYTRARVGAK